MNRLLFSAALLLLAACAGGRSSPAVDGDRIYGITEVDVKPQIRNHAALRELLQRRLRAGTAGTAFCEFVVERDGTSSSVRISKSSNIAELDSAALEVHRAALWTPATEGGVPVRVRAELPVTFEG